MSKRTVGGKIKLARQQSGLTQNELARKMSVSPGTVSNWEVGNATPEKDQQGRLEAILGKGLFSKEEATTVAEGVSIVGAWLLKARQKRGVTQQEPATKSGVTQVTISHIETGRARSPQPRTIRLLEQALGEPFEKDAERELEEASEIEGLGRFMDFDPYDDKNWPSVPGIYVFYDVSDRPVYVGQGKNIAQRIKDHQPAFWFKKPIVDDGAFVRIDDDVLRGQIETILIKFLKSNAVINKQQADRA